MIHLTNLNRLSSDLRSELLTAQEEVLQSGQVMLGKFTQQFEEALAERSGASHCVVVGSGSDALMYGLRAAGEDSVCVPAQSFIATPNSCLRADIDITWCDVDTKGCIDWNSVTHNAIWVGLFGNDCKLDTTVKIYEDGAQHFGLPLRGVFASYSFDPTKSLPNFGNGGAVVTNDAELADRVRKLRRHGVVNRHVGGNSIMSERDCAECLVKLDFFDTWTQRRREIAEYYIEQLSDYVEIVTDPKGMVSKFVIATARKNELRNYLTVNQIQTKENYAKPLIAMPQATVNCERFLSIPCDSYTTNKEASMIVEAFKMFFEPVPFKTQL
jgi:dTDP-4-amino-4,6-dideoxygalactose transaminase